MMRSLWAVGLFGFLSCGGGSSMPSADLATVAANDLAASAPDMARADLATTSAGDLSGGMVVTNVVGACSVKAIVPDATEVGYLAAARLSPPPFPFAVSGLLYTLVGAGADPKCDSDLSHRVELYASSALAPAATPTLVHAIDVPAGSAGQVTARDIALDVSPPLMLQNAQHLFVAVKISKGTGTQGDVFTCVATCSGGVDDRQYWSSASAVPYTWVTLASLGADVTLAIAAVGK